MKRLRSSSAIRPPRHRLLLAAAALLLAVGCSGRKPGGHQIRLTDVTSKSGVAFRHTDGSSGRYYMPETMTAGLALFDYDGDGYVDIYFLTGAPLQGTDTKGPLPRNALYRNRGGLRFVDVTEAAGLGDEGYGLGVTVADYDNDGDPDVLVSNYGPNVLYRNNGDGTFSDVTAEAGVGGGGQMGAGACFLDIEGDGDLDLFASNYVNFAYDTHVARTVDGFSVYPSPLDYSPVPDMLYRNNGDGTFTDISVESGIAAHAGTGMGTICIDYDQDGDTDIFVANDEMGNFLYENDGTGQFREVGMASGLAYDTSGNHTGSMGIACGDYDNDGLLDLYVTSYMSEWATLYRNLGSGDYEDVTRGTGAGAGTLPQVTWGTGFVDLDSDGDRDLFVACGNFQKDVETFDRVAVYQARNIVLMNAGDGKFLDVTDDAGDGLSVERSSRGAAFDDMDNDGDMDAVILNSRQKPTILRNDSTAKNHWLQIRLRATRCNRDGVGARVKVVAGDLIQVDEVHSGRGYQSHWGTRLHFGLGQRDRVDRIEVRWSGGQVDSLAAVRADQLITVTQGATSPTRLASRDSR